MCRTVVTAWIDPESGGLATTRCPEAVEEVFLEDFTPTALCPHHDGWRALPLRQPEEIDGDRQHPFKRWLRMIRGGEREREAS